jgi:hypothetical protein
LRVHPPYLYLVPFHVLAMATTRSALVIPLAWATGYVWHHANINPMNTTNTTTFNALRMFPS